MRDEAGEHPVRKASPPRYAAPGGRPGAATAVPTGPEIAAARHAATGIQPPPAASEDTRVRDDVPKLRRAGFVRAFRDSLRQASPPRPEQLGDEARVGATLAVAHPATLSRPEGARSPIPNPARLRFLRAKWRPRAYSGNALAMDAQRLRLFTDAENVLSCTSIFLQGRGTG